MRWFMNAQDNDGDMSAAFAKVTSRRLAAWVSAESNALAEFRGPQISPEFIGAMPNALVTMFRCADRSASPPVSNPS
jgi:hypothetical protein